MIPRIDSAAGKLENGEEQTYITKPGDRHSLATWKELLKSGEMTHEQFQEISEEPFFETEVDEFEGLDTKDFKECGMCT